MTNKKAAFYFLPDNDTKARELYICRLAAKAYDNQLKTYIHTSSDAESDSIDLKLWVFKDISFVPHAILRDASMQTLPPVLIGAAIAPPNIHNDVLINLTHEIPKFASYFPHIIEVIPNDVNWLNAAEQHQAEYQAKSYIIATHNVS